MIFNYSMHHMGILLVLWKYGGSFLLELSELNGDWLQLKDNFVFFFIGKKPILYVAEFPTLSK